MKKTMLLLLSIALLLFGCSKNEPEDDTLKVKEGGAELTIARLSDVPEPMKEMLIEKFPQIKFNFIYVQIPTLQPTISMLLNVDLDTLRQEGNNPDIIFDQDGLVVPPHLRDEINFDLTPLIDTNSLDTSVFLPELLNRTTGQDGAVYSLPVMRAVYGLFYNKKVFDANKVPYPVDGMTWDEVIQLSSKFSNGQDEGQYRGLDLSALGDGYLLALDQKGLSFVNPERDESAVSSSEWRSFLQSLQSIYQIPANSSRDILSFYDGKTAMAIGSSAQPLVVGEQKGQDIDLVTFPTLDKGSNIGAVSRFESVMISKESKNKELAFQVISYLVSKEAQTQLSRMGFGSVLDDDGINKQFGEKYPELKSKNIAAFFKPKQPPMNRLSRYEMVGYLAAAPSLNRMIANGIDIDATIQDMDANIKQAITDEKQK